MIKRAFALLLALALPLAPADNDRFLAVTIVAGKSVEWRIPGPEPHSVTFFPAGQQPPPPMP